MNDSVFLLNGERRDPDGDQAVLAVREAVSRVGRDFQEEAAVVASVGQLFLRRAAKRDPAEHKRPRVVSEFLLARVPLVTNELNSLQVFQSALRDADRRLTQTEAQCGTNPRQRSVSQLGLRSPGVERNKTVTKLFLRPM